LQEKEEYERGNTEGEELGEEKWTKLERGEEG
jgi:hypothetical protein